MTRDDAQLVQDIAAGSSGAFEVLHDRHRPAALRLARMLCGDDGRAEEAVQDAFTEIWKHPDRYTERRGPVVGWVLCIVRYRALDVARRNGKHAERRADIGESLLNAAPGTTSATVADRDDAAQLTALIARLPERQQQVIGLAFYGQLTHAEIAACLQLPSGTVKGRMRLGLSTLRGEIEQRSASERWHGRLTEAFYAGNLDRALEIVGEAAAGMPAVTVLDDVVAPAMHAIGSLWAREQITIADEHRASATCDRLLTAVSGRLRVAPADTLETVMLATLQHEQHTFGLRMVGEVLGGAGYGTVMLGSVGSDAAFRTALRRHQPAVVALSTTVTHPDLLADAVAAVHDTLPGAHTITGGAASSAVAQDLRDRHVTRLDTLVENVEGLLRPANGKPRKPSAAGERAQRIVAAPAKRGRDRCRRRGPGQTAGPG